MGDVRTLQRLVAAGTTHTNSTVEAALDSITFPANFWQVGKRVRAKWMSVTAAQNGTDTLTTFVRFGATGLGDTALFTSLPVDQVVSDVSYVEVELICRTITDGETLGSFFAVALGSDPDAPHSPLLGAAGTAIASLDTEAATTMVFSGDWSVANAGNQVAAQFGVIDEITD